MKFITDFTDGKWQDVTSIKWDSKQKHFIPIAQKMNMLQIEINFAAKMATRNLEYTIFYYKAQIKWFKDTLEQIGTVSIYGFEFCQTPNPSNPLRTGL